MFIAPVANTAYIRRRPYVTVALIALNTAVWLYGWMAPGPRQPVGDHGRIVEQLYRKHGLPFEAVPVFELKLARGMVLHRSHPDFRRWLQSRREAEAALSGMGDYLVQVAGFVPERSFDHRLVTSLFLHGDFMHLLMNMIFLFLFGCSIEDQWGRWKYLLFYLVAGVAANFAHYASAPLSDLPLVGASGAVSGVMGAFIVFHAMTRIRFFWWFFLFGFFEVPAWIAIAAWFLLQVLNVVSFHLTVVAYWAHIGGFLVGLAIALPVRLLFGPVKRQEGPGPAPDESQVALPGAGRLARNWAHQEQLTRAELHIAEGEPSQAVPIFQQILEREPRHVEARLGMVRAYRALGMRREATSLGQDLIEDLTADGRGDEARQVYSLLMS